MLVDEWFLPMNNFRSTAEWEIVMLVRVGIRNVREKLNDIGDSKSFGYVSAVAIAVAV